MRLYLPNTHYRENDANNYPNIDAIALLQAIQSHRRAQYAFHKNYKTAHPQRPKPIIIFTTAQHVLMR